MLWGVHVFVCTDYRTGRVHGHGPRSTRGLAGRDCQWQCRRSRADRPRRSRESRDLLAQVLSTNKSTTSTDGLSRDFALAVKPELVAAASASDGVLALFLAIATEGFWSQGSACHALLGDEWGVSAPSRSADESDIRPAKNLIDGLHKQSAALKG